MHRRFLNALAIVWLALCGNDIVLRLRTGAGSTDYDPGEASCDALDQQLAEGAPPEGAAAPGAYLQAALLHMSSAGLAEDLLCAREVPLHLGIEQHLGLFFQGAWPDGWWGGRRLELEYYATKVRAPASYHAIGMRVLPWHFGEPGRSFSMDCVWQGRSAGVQFLRVVATRSMDWDGHRSRSNGSAHLPSLALLDGQPSFHLFPEQACVLALQITAQSMRDAPLATRAFWHERARQLLTAARGSAAQVQAGTSQLSIAATGTTFEAPEPIVSGTVASLLFRDREMARAWYGRAAELGPRRDPELPNPPRHPGDGSAPNGSRQAAELLLGKAPRLDKLPFGPERVVWLRCLLLGQDAATAQRCVEVLRWQLHGDFAATVVQAAATEVAPAAAPAWHDLVATASANGWPLMRSPWVRWCLWLAPFGIAGWLAVGGQVRHSRPVPLRGDRLLWLALCASSVLFLPLVPLAVLTFAILLARRRNAGMPTLERVLAVLAFGGQSLWCMSAFGAPPLPPVLHSLAVHASGMMWVVVGGWVLLDGRWRTPRTMACSLLCQLAPFGLFLTGASMEILQVSGTIAALLGTATFVAFLAGGHWRNATPAATTPQPVAG